MATETVGTEMHTQAWTTRRRGLFTGPPVRLSWAAILGGSVVALAVWVLLYAFGLAVGLSAVDPNNASSLKASGIFTGIWSLLIPVIAMFVGGAVASRGAEVGTRVGGALHGLVTWGIVTLAGAWLLTSVLSAVLSGVGMAAMAGTAAMSAMPQTTMAQGYQSTIAEAIRPMNQRLQAEGKPPVRAEQLEVPLMVIIRQAAEEGRMSKDAMILAITRNSDLSRQDADAVATQVGARFDELRHGAQNTAAKATDATGKAFWGIFGVLVLGLISATAGAMIGATKRQRTIVSTASPLPPSYPHDVSEVHP